MVAKNKNGFKKREDTELHRIIVHEFYLSAR